LTVVTVEAATDSGIIVKSGMKWDGIGIVIVIDAVTTCLSFWLLSIPDSYSKSKW
jgi:hypothetical protein